MVGDLVAERVGCPGFLSLADSHIDQRLCEQLQIGFFPEIVNTYLSANGRPPIQRLTGSPDTQSRWVHKQREDGLGVLMLKRQYAVDVEFDCWDGEFGPALIAAKVCAAGAYD